MVSFQFEKYKNQTTFNQLTLTMATSVTSFNFYQKDVRYML
ncbi:hypothetical protein JCM19301_2388 [Jejuia pallidilutea]|uniref:Uncharacterized protein n=1 Tax=Jejuia pallidilutea TaxID=504487 RepID=A0A090VQJ4_9FLAO|nr:hypothetical protein JCM19301_2388 [Jejuia pallidilutea]GAL87986.1 hypothetical protein JCM19538_2349 [Jejuia pallidilutea]